MFFMPAFTGHSQKSCLLKGFSDGYIFSRFVVLIYVAFSSLVLSVLAHRASANLSNKNDTNVYKLVFSADERLAVKPDDG